MAKRDITITKILVTSKQHETLRRLVKNKKVQRALNCIFVIHTSPFPWKITLLYRISMVSSSAVHIVCRKIVYSLNSALLTLLYLNFSLFGKARNKLAPPGKSVRTESLLWPSCTTPKVGTTKVILKTTFSPPLRKLWAQIGCGPLLNLRGVQEKTLWHVPLMSPSFQQDLTWEQQRKDLALAWTSSLHLSYLQPISGKRKLIHLNIWNVYWFPFETSVSSKHESHSIVRYGSPSFVVEQFVFRRRVQADSICWFLTWK